MFWLWVASASALSVVPVEVLLASLEVVAHARAGVHIPEVIVGTSLFEADTLL